MTTATHAVSHDGRRLVVQCGTGGTQHVHPRKADGSPVTDALCLSHMTRVRLGCGCGAFASLPSGPTSGHDYAGCMAPNFR